jgi:hypothetical protein
MRPDDALLTLREECPGELVGISYTPELKIDQPTKFELIVNLKGASSLGIEILPTILVRADKAIE